VVIAAKASGALPKEGDLIYFEIPEALGTIRSLRADVHIYVFDTLPPSPLHALSQLSAARASFWCTTQGLEMGRGGVELRADWFIDNRRSPELKPTSRPFRPATSPGMQQVRVQVHNNVFGDFEYLFDTGRTAWRPIFDAEDALRVCPKRSWSGEAPQHELDHGEVDERLGGRGEIFEVAGEPAISADPSEGTLDDPALGLNNEAGAIGAFDDLDAPVAGAASGLADTWPLVSGVGEDRRDKWKAPPHRLGQNERRAIAVLDARRMDDGSEQKALVVGEDMTLDPLDLFARVEPDRVDRAPPFCIDLALWLSRRAAEGLASRPSCSRAAT
jgi:hypothetical protein